MLRANTSAGIDEIAQRYVWYDRSVSKVDIVEAYSVDAGGVCHDVLSDQMRDIQELRSAGAPTFQDAKLRVVIFPAVGVGLTVHLRFRKSQSTPVIAGQFNYYVEPNRRPVLYQRLVFDLPTERPLYADARGFTAGPAVTRNGRTRYTFDYRRVQFARAENGSVGYAQYGDCLLVSTFPDFASFAASYREPAADPTARDPAVSRSRDRLRMRTATRVRKRGRCTTGYAAISAIAMFVGQSPVVLHRVANVLAYRYDDCKDHVALYGALLDAVGIRSEAALIGLGSVYTLPSVPGYGSGAINHVITYLPDLDVYADSTASSVEFGFLPLADMDRPTLLRRFGHAVAHPRFSTCRAMRDCRSTSRKAAARILHIGCRTADTARSQSACACACACGSRTHNVGSRSRRTGCASRTCAARAL